ncbi:MAG: FtsX-like permease family protein [Pseudomonadales bacterium]
MNLRLALKLLWRDWRSGELTLLLASLVIAVGTVTTITLFVDRLQQALINESSTFLAADRVISSRSPLDADILEKAETLGLEQAQTLSFLSMVFSDDRAQMASVKAVDPRYPLRGDLIIADEPFVRGNVVNRGPPPGRLWLESRLMPSLDVVRGDMLEIGVASFEVGKALIKEPDRGGGFNSVGPRVMMNLADVDKTEVIQPGSRITWRYLFAGDTTQLDTFQAWAEPRLPEDTRMFGVKEGTEGIGDALDRAERFLLLGGLLGVVLAGVAIALAAQRYSVRHYDHVAILKTLGATPNGINTIYLVIFLVLGTIATLLGSGIGYVAQSVIVQILDPYIPVALPNPGVTPVWLGLVTGFVCLFAFALPPLLKLRATQPVRVIRRDFEDESITDRFTYVFAVAGTLGLMWWYSQDWYLTLLIFSGGLVALVVLSLVAWGLLRSGRVLGMQAGSAWRLALAGMQRRGQENTLQILVFSLAIMLLLMLFLIRTALIEDWRAQIPENAPNHFAINISPRDTDAIRDLLEANNVQSQPLYPMIRGRITTVNGEPVAQWVKDHREPEVTRDTPRASSGRNLTWSATLPGDNEIIAGEWWPEDYDGNVLVSLERDLARGNNLSTGDELVFNIQGRELKARVANVRTVSWDSMRPNFYIIFSPGALDEFPSTYMTSFHLADDNKLFLNELLREFPTMTVIEVDAIIEQIQQIIQHVTMAIELVLVLIVIAGGLVLLASIQASMDERFKQHAILRTLGASRKLIMGSLIIEFAALGFFAGVLATLGAEVAVYGLETEIFDLQYHVNPQLWLLGPVIGTLLIGTIGTLATRRVVNSPPTTILREL